MIHDYVIYRDNVNRIIYGRITKITENKQGKFYKVYQQPLSKRGAVGLKENDFQIITESEYKEWEKIYYKLTYAKKDETLGNYKIINIRKAPVGDYYYEIENEKTISQSELAHNLLKTRSQSAQNVPRTSEI